MQPSRQPSLGSLTGIRFFAFIHVVLHHFIIMVPAFRSAAPEWLKRFVAAAPSAVCLFFVLSGFILVYNYLGRDGCFRVSNREFWAARVARIYPLYLFGLLVYAPIAVARYYSGTGLSVINVGPGPTFWISGVLSLFLVQTWSIVLVAWNPPTWSISAEAFFYSLFPWAARRISGMSAPKLIGVVSAFWVVSLAFPIYFLIAILGHSSKQIKEIWEIGLGDMPLLRVAPFLIGMATGVFYLRTRVEGAKPRPVLLAGTVVAILISYAAVPIEAARLLEYSLAPVFGFLIYLLAFDRGWLTWILANPVSVRLGEASYAMYVLHNPLWNYLARFNNIRSILFQRHFPAGLAKPGIATEWNYDMSWGMFSIYLALLVGLSLLASHYIEQPARLLLRNWFAKREQRIAVSPARVQKDVLSRA